MIKHVNIKDNSIEIDGNELKFPIALEEVEALLGKPDETVSERENELKYIYHELGIVFEARVNDRKWFKYWKLDADEAHTITGVFLYCGETVKLNIMKPHCRRILAGFKLPRMVTTYGLSVTELKQKSCA